MGLVAFNKHVFAIHRTIIYSGNLLTNSSIARIDIMSHLSFKIYFLIGGLIPIVLYKSKLSLL